MVTNDIHMVAHDLQSGRGIFVTNLLGPAPPSPIATQKTPWGVPVTSLSRMPLTFSSRWEPLAIVDFPQAMH